jgi:uncharacterized membrane protein
MISEITFAEFAHVLFGMMWVGVSIYIELVLAPILKRTKVVGEYRQLLPIMGKTSAVQLMSGLLVVLTGVVYMLLRYPLDRILTVSSGQLVIVGLVLVLAALTNGMVFLKPTAMKIVKTSWPDDPNAAVPEAVLALQGRLLKGTLVNTAIVVVVLFLMVTAATGGL